MITSVFPTLHIFLRRAKFYFWNIWKGFFDKFQRRHRYRNSNYYNYKYSNVHVLLCSFRAFLFTDFCCCVLVFHHNSYVVACDLSVLTCDSICCPMFINMLKNLTVFCLIVTVRVSFLVQISSFLNDFKCIFALFRA